MIRLTKPIKIALAGLALILLFIGRDVFLDFLPNSVRQGIGLEVRDARRLMGKIQDIPFIVYQFLPHRIPVYNLTIAEDKLQELDQYYYETKNDPLRGKEYKNAIFRGDDGVPYEVEVTYRGDSEMHFTDPKKSWRIAMDSEKLFEHTQVFDLILPEDRQFFAEQLANHRAKKLGLFAPESKFVFLKVNGRNVGVYFMIEHWSKESLEKEILPSDTNLFGEEGFGSDYLYSDTSLWQDYLLEGDTVASRASLDRLISILKNPSDEYFFKQIGSILDLESFHRWSALMALMGSSSADQFHNARLYFDTTLGKFKFVPWDTGLGVIEDGRNIDAISIEKNPLIRRMFSNPKFFAERNRIIWEYVSDEKNIADDLAMYDELSKTVSRSFFKDQLKLYTNLFFKSETLRMRGIVESNTTKLRGFLSAQNISVSLASNLPAEENRVSYSAMPFAIKTRTSGMSPVQLREILVSTNAPIFGSLRLFRDSNRNGILEPSDSFEGSFTFDAERKAYILSNSKIQFSSMLGTRTLRDGAQIFDSIPVEDTLFAVGSFEKPANATFEVSMSANNAITGEVFVPVISYVVNRSDFAGADDISLDRNAFLKKNPMFSAVGEKGIALGPGAITLMKNVIIPEEMPLTIRPGTSIYLSEGVSVLSYSEVQAVGSPAAPIRLMPLQAEGHWGTFAIIGAPRESVFKNVTFMHQIKTPPPADPDGHEVSTPPLNGIQFRGMFSAFHSDIRVEQSEFVNAGGDDGMNAKFGTVAVVGNTFRGNSADAFDGDAIKGVLSGNRFIGNGNDGIDVSGADIIIRENKIENSGDKGMSIGEHSKAIIFNNSVTRSITGIAVKDASSADIISNVLVNNKTGLALYMKKPIFGGGVARVVNTILWGNEKTVDPEHDSEVTISYSVVEGGFEGGHIETFEPQFMNAEGGDFRLTGENESVILRGGLRSSVEPYRENLPEQIPMGILQ